MITNGQLLVSAVLVLLTVIVQAVLFDAYIRFYGPTFLRMLKKTTPGWMIVPVIITVLVILFTHLAEISLWAIFYFVAGEIATFKTSLYFSAVTFTTLGYGDITLSERWQLISAIEAVNGVLLLGWSTAFLFSVLTQIWQQENRIEPPG
jgi:voltage-gated potassium channel Kch